MQFITNGPHITEYDQDEGISQFSDKYHDIDGRRLSPVIFYSNSSDDDHNDHKRIEEVLYRYDTPQKTTNLPEYLVPIMSPVRTDYGEKYHIHYVKIKINPRKADRQQCWKEFCEDNAPISPEENKERLPRNPPQGLKACVEMHCKKVMLTKNPSHWKHGGMIDDKVELYRDLGKFVPVESEEHQQLDEERKALSTSYNQYGGFVEVLSHPTPVPEPIAEQFVIPSPPPPPSSSSPSTQKQISDSLTLLIKQAKKAASAAVNRIKGKPSPTPPPTVSASTNNPLNPVEKKPGEQNPNETTESSLESSPILPPSEDLSVTAPAPKTLEPQTSTDSVLGPEKDNKTKTECAKDFVTEVANKGGDLMGKAAEKTVKGAKDAAELAIPVATKVAQSAAIGGVTGAINGGTTALVQQVNTPGPKNGSTLAAATLTGAVTGAATGAILAGSKTLVTEIQNRTTTSPQTVNKPSGKLDEANTTSKTTSITNQSTENPFQTTASSKNLESPDSYSLPMIPV